MDWGNGLRCEDCTLVWDCADSNAHEAEADRENVTFLTKPALGDNVFLSVVTCLFFCQEIGL